MHQCFCFLSLLQPYILLQVQPCIFWELWTCRVCSILLGALCISHLLHSNHQRWFGCGWSCYMHACCQVQSWLCYVITLYHLDSVKFGRMHFKRKLFSKPNATAVGIFVSVVLHLEPSESKRFELHWQLCSKPWIWQLGSNLCSWSLVILLHFFKMAVAVKRDSRGAGARVLLCFFVL